MRSISRIIFILGLLLFLQATSCKQADSSIPFNKSYICSGNEPFWMVKIEPDSVVFKTPENEVAYPAPRFRKEKDQLIFETQLAHATMSSKLKITMMDTTCTDSMSGIASKYTVTVEKDGETYAGCGREP